jgi:hypothetical protein
MGSALAFLTLVRPSYLYLFYGFTTFFLTFALLKRHKTDILRFLLLGTVFIAAVSPWAIRNKVQFDSFALTSGNYAEAILLQRVSYNDMSWPEVAVSFLYWFPDFGDSLAQKIFPPALTAKLGWDQGSYYMQGQAYEAKIQALSDQLGGSDKILNHLIFNQVLTVKHMVLSLALAWRGLFIAKYWSVLGFISFAGLMVYTLRLGDYRLLALSLPIFFMVAFHAGLSVSIPRYNIPLVFPYALSMAWYIKAYGQKFFAKIRHA